MQRTFDVVVEKDEEGCYIASYRLFPDAIRRRDLDELDRRIREAIELCLEVEGFPESNLEFVGIQRVVIAA